MSEGVLLTNNLDAFYGDFQALFGVSIQVNKGEIVSIIGANGAGKTTFMRSVTGLLRNPKNKIYFKGKQIDSLRADQIAKIGIAMVPEGRQLFKSLSAEENLLIGATLKRKGYWSLEKVYNIFPILKELRHLPSTALSGGQQQMLAIGRALMSNPEIILFDEISLGLAPIIIKNIYKVLPSIVKDGMSAIIIEQDITKAIQNSNHIYCLQEGKISLDSNSSSISQEEITKAYFGI